MSAPLVPQGADEDKKASLKEANKKVRGLCVGAATGLQPKVHKSQPQPSTSTSTLDLGLILLGLRSSATGSGSVPQEARGAEEGGGLEAAPGGLEARREPQPPRFVSACMFCSSCRLIVRPSLSRAGEMVFENTVTGERQAWFPDGPAASGDAAKVCLALWCRAKYDLV